MALTNTATFLTIPESADSSRRGVPGQIVPRGRGLIGDAAPLLIQSLFRDRDGGS